MRDLAPTVVLALIVAVIALVYAVRPLWQSIVIGIVVAAATLLVVRWRRDAAT